MVRTGIVCTIGPASSDAKTLRAMARAGMDVARLNFSHGSLKEHMHRVELIRALNLRDGRSIGILVDLEGNRIRVGRLIREIPLRCRQTVFLTNDPAALRAGWIPFDYTGSLRDIAPGNRIYIEDGTIALKVVKSTRRSLTADVVVPGIVKSRKGINIPDASLVFDGLSDNDRAHIRFAIENKVAFIAQSFVRFPSDITPIRALLARTHPACKIIAKIENRQGIDNVDRILDVADGIMVARGDMGISIPIYQVPVVQKQIIRLCNRRNKIVITATQMLESMTENLVPTRAEVTDVANAMIDGTTMVMLSGETAVGKHPVETVRLMNRILQYTESWTAREGRQERRTSSPKK